MWLIKLYGTLRYKQITKSGPEGLLLFKKKETCHLFYLPVPADNKVKVKVNEEIDKYLDLDKIRGRTGIIQTTALLRSARIIT